MVNYHTLEMKSGYTLLGWQPSSYQIIYLETSPTGACDHPLLPKNSSLYLLTDLKKKKKETEHLILKAPEMAFCLPDLLQNYGKEWKTESNIIWDRAINSMKETEVEMAIISYLLTV